MNFPCVCAHIYIYKYKYIRACPFDYTLDVCVLSFFTYDSQQCSPFLEAGHRESFIQRPTSLLYQTTRIAASSGKHQTNNRPDIGNQCPINYRFKPTPPIRP